MEGMSRSFNIAASEPDFQLKMVSQWFPSGFSVVSQWFLSGFPVVSQCFRLGSWNFNDGVVEGTKS